MDTPPVQCCVSHSTSGEGNKSDLPYETIESALKGETRFGGYPPGVIPLAYTDDSRLQGDYTIFIKIERDVPFTPPSVWSTCPAGRFQTPDGDVIDYLIESGMSATSDTIEFVLALGPNVTWKKILNLPDGEGNNWNIQAEGAGLTARQKNSLWAHQVKNGQNLTFIKAKEFGRMVDVLKVGDIQGLTPGSRITFTWMKD